MIKLLIVLFLINLVPNIFPSVIVILVGMKNTGFELVLFNCKLWKQER